MTTRYFYHGESGSLFTEKDPNDATLDAIFSDGCVDEVSREQYETLLARETIAEFEDVLG